MKKVLLASALLAVVLFGCQSDDDNNVPSDLRINNFIWKGLNQYISGRPMFLTWPTTVLQTSPS